jgi:hypothetical protein
MSVEPEVELLWWDGCPSTEHARELLRAALNAVGLDSAEIRMVEVQTDTQAQSLGFGGSPTILIDGVDVTELACDEGSERAREPAPAGLTCRAYRRRDGRISPTPDPEDLRDALLQASRRRALGVAGSAT